MAWSVQPFAADPYTGLSVDSSAFRQRAPVVQLSEDPDTATQQTVQEMCRQIHQAARDPLVRAIAHQAVKSIRGGPAWVGTGLQPFEHPRIMAESCWWWCKTHLKFAHHSGMFEVWFADLGDPRTKLQLLISPDVLVRMKQMKGDCAIYTMMIAAMLEALGLKWEICTGAVDQFQRDIFSHVWPRVVLPDGGREPLDASHGKYPGWQVPPQDIYRLKVWSETGGEVANQARSFSGLHAYRARRGFGAYRVRRGMGAYTCDESGCYDDGSGDGSGGSYVIPTGPVDPTAPFGGYPVGIQTGGGVTVGPVGSNPVYETMPGTWTDSSGNTWANPQATVVPPSGTPQYAALMAALAKTGMTLAQQAQLKPGMAILPNGTMLYQNPGYAVTTGGGASSLLGSSSMSSMLPWILGLGLVGMMFMGSKR